MFEKEAEEYGEKDLGGKYLSSVVAKDKLHAYKLGQYDGFIAGAEFGYNKANEWHYVKDELPPEDVPLLCVRGGKIYVAWYYNGIYHDSRCCQVKKPYAWKEIVLPKELE